MSAFDPHLAAELKRALARGPADRTVTHRIGTSNPADFPVGNVDPVNDSLWNRRMLHEQQPLVGNDRPGMAAFLGPEADGLVAMGYGACSCFPIVIAGHTRGVVALLGDAGIFTPAALAEIDTLLPIAALTFTFEGISER
jgi:hypothetical protein